VRVQQAPAVLQVSGGRRSPAQIDTCASHALFIGGLSQMVRKLSLEEENIEAVTGNGGNSVLNIWAAKQSY